MLDSVFAALADPTRRGMLAQLARGPATVGELGAPFGITKGAITKHVKVLERSGLLRRDVRGRVHFCNIDPTPLDQAEEWVEHIRSHWESRFDSLAGYLEELQGKGAIEP